MKAAENQVFRSSKNRITTAFLWVICIGLIVVIAAGIVGGYDLWPFYVITGASDALLLWILLQTRYRIDKDFLYYTQGPFRGKIAISSITKIVRDDSWIKGTLLKPALDYRGMMISYGTYDSIFISPENPAGFLAIITTRNPAIRVEGYSPI